MSEVSVVAGGWSFNVVPHEFVPGHVIAVNEAAFRLHRKPDSIVSMDRLWTESRWGDLWDLRLSTWLRRSAVQNLNKDLLNQSWLTVFECDHESVSFSNDSLRLNGTNSGTCALNLAWQMKPTTLYLFGFDMCAGPDGQRHWYPDYAWMGGTIAGKYRTWANEFKFIKQQFDSIGTKVYNVSERSLITAFDRISVRDLVRVAA